MFKKILTQSISSAVLLLGVPAFSGSCFGKNSTANPKSPSASEILSPADFGVLHNQLISCWTIPPGAVEAEKLDIEIEVEMNPDTTVKSAVVKSVSRKEDPFVHAFIGSALQAFKDPKCKFLALPVDRYDHWKTMSLHFDLKDIL